MGFVIDVRNGLHKKTRVRVCVVARTPRACVCFVWVTHVNRTLYVSMQSYMSYMYIGLGRPCEPDGGHNMARVLCQSCCNTERHQRIVEANTHVLACWSNSCMCVVWGTQ